MEACLSSPTDIAGFRSEAQLLLAQQVPPEAVQWRAPAPQSVPGSSVHAPAEPRARSVPRAASAIVPASFVRLCEFVVQHRDPERFALLYRLLWRLVHEPGLRHDTSDPDMARVQHMAHAVRRDIHKFKSHVRFREIPRVGQPALHVAWCEPAHQILDTAAPWFTRRHADLHWVLFTPERSAYWDGQTLYYAGGLPASPGAAAPDTAWVAAWTQLFGG